MGKHDGRTDALGNRNLRSVMNAHLFIFGKDSQATFPLFADRQFFLSLKQKLFRQRIYALLYFLLSVR